MKLQPHIFSVIAFALLIFASATAQNTPVDKFLKKYPSAEGVTNISMSQQMLRSIFASSKSLSQQPLNVPEAYASLTISQKDIPDYYYTDFIKMLIASDYESYMEMKMENSQRMSYFIRKLDIHNNEIVVLRQQKDHFSSIYISGNIEIDDLDIYLRQIRNHLLNRDETATGLTQQAKTTAEDAKNTALAKVGGGTVVRVETKYPPHGMEYKVMIVAGDNRHDVHISAGSGQIINYHADKITKTAPHAQGRNTAGIISAEQAKSIAIKAADGGIITDCNLDYPPHLAALTYHIHVGKGQYEYCVELYAATGVVFKVEPRYKP